MLLYDNILLCANRARKYVLSSYHLCLQLWTRIKNVLLCSRQNFFIQIIKRALYDSENATVPSGVCVLNDCWVFVFHWSDKVGLGLWELEPFGGILFKACSITANTLISLF